MAKDTLAPYEVTYGANVVKNITELTLNQERERETVQYLDGGTGRYNGNWDISVDITVAKDDIDTLAVLVPQYHVADGETMSTGEVVDNEDGAIDVSTANCDTDEVTQHLEIKACNGRVLRIVDASSDLNTSTFNQNYGTTTVTFYGRAEGGRAAVQYFKAGSLTPAS